MYAPVSQTPHKTSASARCIPAIPSAMCSTPPIFSRAMFRRWLITIVYLEPFKIIKLHSWQCSNKDISISLIQSAREWGRGRGEGNGKVGKWEKRECRKIDPKFDIWLCANAPGGYCHAPYILESYFHWPYFVAVVCLYLKSFKGLKALKSTIIKK